MNEERQHDREFCGKAIEYCQGMGVEIGALDKPLALEGDVIFLDRNSTSELRKIYARDPRGPFVIQVHIVWKESRYPFFDDNAFDFVANSHVLEHVANPGRQIEEWIRIIRPGGILYMIVPDKRFCFDRRREVTSLSHLMQEFQDDVDTVSIDHYRDYIINTNGEDGINRETSESYVEKCYKEQGSIHVHVFTADSLEQFLQTLKQYVPFDVVYYDPKNLHIHVALRKTAAV